MIEKEQAHLGTETSSSRTLPLLQATFPGAQRISTSFMPLAALLTSPSGTFQEPHPGQQQQPCVHFSSISSVLLWNRSQAPTTVTKSDRSFIQKTGC